MKRIAPYVSIARPDHWFKNVFAVPGMLLAMTADPALAIDGLWSRLALAMVALCATASSNYVINEVLDAKHDRHHPQKKSRHAAKGDVSPVIATIEWLALGALGVGLGWLVNPRTGAALASLWVMGVIYNVPPIRSKDKPYIDVLSESVNNPIRLWIGWSATGTLLVPPLSIDLAYWMLGAFVMAVKRLAEYRFIADKAVAAAYRPSFAFYDEERLLVSILAYAAASGMFGGMFIVRYRLELVLAVPFVAVFFAVYLRTGLAPDSPAAAPERLYTDRALMFYAVAVFLLCALLLVVDIPSLGPLFAPSIAPELP